MKIIIKLTVVVSCGLALAACGGGDNGDGNTSPGSGNTGGSGSGTGSSTQTAYTVTPSISGGGGAINPATPVSVQSGATVSFTLQPSSGYTIAPMGGTCGGTLSGATYTTKAITASCTVIAVFNSKPLTLAYEGLTPATDITSFVSQLNQEGTKGYRYLYGQAFPVACTDIVSAGGMQPPCGPSQPPVSVFVNDGTAPSYTYESQPNPGNVTDFITQANAEGAKGYRFAGWYGSPVVTTTSVTPPPYALYRKDGGSVATYTYVADTAGPMASNDAFVIQANTHGQSGYWFYGRIGQSFTTSANLYVKNNMANATYTYQAVTLEATSASSQLAQINSEGAQGYRPTYQLTPNVDIPASNLFAMLYMKDQTQSATFTFQSDSPAENGTDLVNQLNSYGTQGYAAWMYFLTGISWYFKAANCSGWLCTTLDSAASATSYLP